MRPGTNHPTPFLPGVRAGGEPLWGKGPGRPEWLFWILPLAVINLPLLFGGRTATWVLAPETGIHEPWRWFTHPFAHVSLYHLLLDGGAFLALLQALPGGFSRRIGLVAACAAGSLAGAWFDPVDIRVIGFCGLSGIAHGLAAALGWWTWKTGPDRTAFAGLAVTGILVAKSIWEVATGGVFLAALHAGNVGTPVVGCHLGGCLAGLTLAWRTKQTAAPGSPEPPSCALSGAGTLTA